MAGVVAARRRRFRNMQMRAQRVAIRAQQAPRRGRVVPPPKTWQERLDRAVDALVDGEEDALNEELLGRIESYASARRHSLAVQSALTRDPYRALGRLARPLAARVTVRSLERVRTRSESTVRAVLALRGTRSLSVVYEALDGEDFEILAISVDAPFGQSDVGGRAGGNLAEFTTSLGLTFPILHNPSGNIQRIYQTTGVPESFLIGKDGIIHKKVAGETTWDAPENEELIRRLLSAD